MKSLFMQYKKKITYQNILVRFPNWLGDAVMALPVLSILRDRFPNAQITLLVHEKIGAFLKDCGFRVIICPEMHFAPGIIIRTWRTALKQIHFLRNLHFDLAIHLTNSFVTALIVFLARIPRRIGLARRCRRLFLTDQIPYIVSKKHKESQHSQYVRIISPLVKPDAKIKSRIVLNAAVKEHIKNQFLQVSNKSEKGMIGIAPGAYYGPAKRWSIIKFSALAKEFIRRGYEIVLLGGNDEIELAQSIPEKLNREIINLAGRTSLTQLAAIITNLKLVVCNDSGILHLSAALEIPAIGIFGSTDPEITAPVEDHVAIVRKTQDCSPCFKRLCKRGDYACLEKIAVDDVLQTAEKFL